MHLVEFEFLRVRKVIVVIQAPLVHPEHQVDRDWMEFPVHPVRSDRQV